MLPFRHFRPCPLVPHCTHLLCPVKPPSLLPPPHIFKPSLTTHHPSCRYIEPPAAVPINNELAAARGEMYAAEEAVLWRLTGRVVEAVDEIQGTLDKVRTLGPTGVRRVDF